MLTSFFYILSYALYTVVCFMRCAVFRSTYVILTILCISVAGCKSTGDISAKQHNNPTTLLKKDLFAGHQNIDVETQEEIFALNDEVKSLVKTKVLADRDFQSRSIKLIEFIFGTDSKGLAYRSNATLTAQDAFDSKSANCISLTILAYSLTEAAGLDAVFQDVRVPEYWVRNGAYNMLSGHVNLRIKRKRGATNLVLFSSNGLEIDFDPFIQKQNFPKRPVNKNVVTAMFYNNKGAMAIVEQDYPRAYRYLQAAVEIAPQYASSWANLGILYRFNDYHELAEQSYRHAISLDPESLNTLTNLSILLEMQGNFDESREIDAAIIKHRIKNPYYHSLLADEAMYDGIPSQAIKHYKRAIKLDSNIHEFYYGIAKAYTATGDIVGAQRAMRKAIRINRLPQVEDKYTAKLNLLKKRE